MNNKQSHLIDTTDSDAPVKCLGMAFDSDAARRSYFREKLQEKLDAPDFRAIEGFPVGDIEHVVALSDPPYYTACPNPFLAELLAFHTSDNDDTEYHHTPFASDVSEGKQDSICMAHTYHTKVPYRAIARYILHYTTPGDIVLDSFAGTGMTGVACHLCETPDPSFRQALESERKRSDEPSPSWGQRFAVLIDLSPFATFLCRNFNSTLSSPCFVDEAQKLIALSQRELGWVYETNGATSAKHGKINYALWTDVFFCDCGSEVPFWMPNEPNDFPNAIPKTFYCPSCDAALTKRSASRATLTMYDDITGETVTQNKQTLAIIDSKAGKKHSTVFDQSLLARIAQQPYTSYVPNQPMMFKDNAWGDMYRAGIHFGITHVHQFWTKRNLLVLSDLFDKARQSQNPLEMMFLCTSFAVKTGSRMHNVGFKGGRINLAGQTYNTLQLPSISAERNLYSLAEGKLADLNAVFKMPKHSGRVGISTESATHLSSIPDDSVDYVFIDPPFGDNIMYSELSFLYECWLRVFTNQQLEAIVSRKQEKDLGDYQELMQSAFAELFRVLKPGRWTTVAFHNSKNAVWNSIQEALGLAGFVVADVRVLDKGQGTFKQMTTFGAVKNDLVISAYKPAKALEEQFQLHSGSEESAWDFVRAHLDQVPVFVQTLAGNAELIGERQKYLLFDRMIAFHIQRNATIPLSASDFYIGLDEKFPERDEMYFLPEQVSEYDTGRMKTEKVEQLELFVSDERTAIQWVRQQLRTHPRNYSDLQPLYMQEAQRAWDTHEKPIELSTLLDENFVSDSSGIWHVPDPRSESDIEQLRHRSLMREFDAYRESRGKLRIVRTEALRAGFKECWQNADYGTIVEMAKRVKDDIIQEDTALLMYYDNARMLGGE